MKRAVSKKIGIPIWQRSFHGHVIRYKKISKYIYENPIKRQTCKKSCVTAKKTGRRVRPALTVLKSFQKLLNHLKHQFLCSGVGVDFGVTRWFLFCCCKLRASSVTKSTCSSVRPSTEMTDAFSPQAR